MLNILKQIRLNSQARPKNFQTIFSCLKKSPKQLQKLLALSVLAAMLSASIASASTLKKVNNMTGSCISTGGAVECDPITESSALYKLYQASVAKGAVITFLDEPIGTGVNSLVDFMHVCTYKNKPGHSGNGDQPVAIDSCTYKYVEPGECQKFLNSHNGSNQVKSTAELDTDRTKNPVYVRCQTKQYIVASSGAGLAQQYLGMIYKFGTGVAGIIAILVIMFNGIKIIVSGSNDSAMSDAKTQITQSLLALAVLFMSGFILYIINPNFFV
jgi:hypothetical protein